MPGESGTARLVEDISTKLADDERLDADDIRVVLAHFSVDEGFGPFEDYKTDIQDAITRGIGHGAYVRTLQTFEAAGMISQLREDLIDPSLEPRDFEPVSANGRTLYRHIRLGEESSEGVGYIYPPEKSPTAMHRIEMSLRAYLACVGRGFRFDPEMIYWYEADYREFVEAVIDCADGLDDYEITVDTGESDQKPEIRVSLSVAGESYSVAFKQVSDWVKYDALKPVQTALDEHVSQQIYYRAGGNDGWILVAGTEQEDLVSTYLTMDVLG